LVGAGFTFRFGFATFRTWFGFFRFARTIRVLRTFLTIRLLLFDRADLLLAILIVTIKR
jgi:transposase